MVEIVTLDRFEKKIQKIRDKAVKERLKKQINRILDNPEIGEFLKYRPQERKVRIPPYRLIYVYSKSENRIYFIDFDKRDTIYRG